MSSTPMSLLSIMKNFVTDITHIEDSDSQQFNFHLKLIQDSIGQPFGDDASIFFSDDDWFVRYNSATTTNERYSILAEYVKYEVSSFTI